MTLAGSRPSVGYLVSEHPKPSQTFIEREIDAVRARGVRVVEFALWSSQPTRANPWPAVRPLAVFEEGPVDSVRFERAVADVGGRAELERLAAERGANMTIYEGYVRKSVQLVGLLGTNPVGHLHAHFGMGASMVALFVHRMTGLPFSFTVHGGEDVHPRYALEHALKADSAHTVVFASEYARAAFKRYQNAPLPCPSQVVRCGLPRDYFCSQAEFSPRASRLCVVARLERPKRHDILIDALDDAGVRGRVERCEFVGEGNLRSTLESQVRERGLASIVRFRGALSSSDTRRAIDASDICVLPTDDEGVPVAIIEAMARQKLCIAADVGGLREIIEPGVTGMLYDGSSRGLSEALSRALDLPPIERSAMTGRALSLVRDRYVEDDSADQLLRLFAGQDAAQSPTASDRHTHNV